MFCLQSPRPKKFLARNPQHLHQNHLAKIAHSKWIARDWADSIGTANGLLCNLACPSEGHPVSWKAHVAECITRKNRSVTHNQVAEIDETEANRLFFEWFVRGALGGWTRFDPSDEAGQAGSHLLRFWSYCVSCRLLHNPKWVQVFRFQVKTVVENMESWVNTVCLANQLCTWNANRHEGTRTPRPAQHPVSVEGYMAKH